MIEKKRVKLLLILKSYKKMKKKAKKLLIFSENSTILCTMH